MLDGAVNYPEDGAEGGYSRIALWKISGLAQLLLNFWGKCLISALSFLQLFSCRTAAKLIYGKL